LTYILGKRFNQNAGWQGASRRCGWPPQQEMQRCPSCVLIETLREWLKWAYGVIAICL